MDELGKEYTSTYAKRANGLVKNGRARWLDGNTICLVCPPDTLNLEDNNMSNKADNMENMTGVCEKAESRTENLSTNVADILSRIDMIIVQGNTLKDVVMQIQNIPINDSPLGGEDGAQRARAINNIYSAREATNQKLIDLLEKMYNNITQ